MNYIGIDPGKSGAIAVIFETKSNTIFTAVIPLTKEREIDIKSLTNMLSVVKQEGDYKCVLEDVHSLFGMSANSNFQFGRVLGIIEGVLGSVGIQYVKIAPKTWQKELWQGIELEGQLTGKLLKKGIPQFKVDTKATSLKACKKIFPDINLLATERSKIPHDGIVDALLIAEYCRRKVT